MALETELESKPMIDQTHAHTVQGLTPKEELGVTLTHEHLFMDGSSCFELDDSEDAEKMKFQGPEISIPRDIDMR